MLTGSCLCGDIAFEITGPIDQIGPTATAPCAASFTGPRSPPSLSRHQSTSHWRQGEEKVAHYRSSSHGWRNFCPRCGSAVPACPPGGPFAMIPLGNVAEDPGTRSSVHFFTGSMAPWHTIADGLPQHDEYPPEFGPDAMAVEQPTRTFQYARRYGRQLPMRCGDLRIRRRTRCHGQLSLLALPAGDERGACHHDHGGSRGVSLAVRRGSDRQLQDAGGQGEGHRLLSHLRLPSAAASRPREHADSRRLPGRRSESAGQGQYLHRLEGGMVGRRSRVAELPRSARIRRGSGQSRGHGGVETGGRPRSRSSRAPEAKRGSR